MPDPARQCQRNQLTPSMDTYYRRVSRHLSSLGNDGNPTRLKVGDLEQGGGAFQDCSIGNRSHQAGNAAEWAKRTAQADARQDGGEDFRVATRFRLLLRRPRATPPLAGTPRLGMLANAATMAGSLDPCALIFHRALGNSAILNEYSAASRFPARHPGRRVGWTGFHGAAISATGMPRISSSTSTPRPGPQSSGSPISPRVARNGFSTIGRSSLT